jgi:CubicO group peptidase (beta-lactamase class C family)
MKNNLLFLLLLILSKEGFTQTIYFPPLTGNTWDTIAPQSIGYCQPKIDSLYSFLDANNTKAFILLKDGKIVLEKYFGTHTATTPWQWASAGKTITAFMTGIAQQEGHLSITDTSSTYLGQGWTNCTPQQEEKITIWNQLTMTSGLDDGVPDHFCTLDTCLNYLANPGTRWAYHNGPYTLLDGVIENATGQTLNAYTAQKLKIPTGMTGSFFTVGYNNVFFSNARSMARFGSLILNKGNWNGNQIMADTAYFNDMVSTSQNLNKSYGYLWWLNGKTSYMLPTLQTVFNGTINPNAPADMIAAIGSGGQFLNVVPSQNLVWLRMGDEPSSTNVPFLLNDAIWEYVNELTCTTSDIEEQTMSRGIELFPNPTTGEIYLRSEIEMLNYELISLDGKLILSQDLFNQNEENIKLVEIEPGSYFLKVKTTEGLLVEKLIKK